MPNAKHWLEIGPLFMHSYTRPNDRERQPTVSVLIVGLSYGAKNVLSNTYDA